MRSVAWIKERAEPCVRAAARLVRNDRRLPRRGDAAASRRGKDARPADEHLFFVLF
jgi:hypothetical protein